MFQYNYLQDLTIEQLNELGADNWEITGILINTSPGNTYNVFVKKGFQEKTLITNETTGAEFWIDKTFSYGESWIIIFTTIILFSLIGKICWDFLFKKDA